MTIMSATTFHSIWTLVLLVCMISIIFWAYSSKRKRAFDEAAKLVFADEEEQPPAEGGKK